MSKEFLTEGDSYPFGKIDTITVTHPSVVYFVRNTPLNCNKIEILRGFHHQTLIKLESAESNQNYIKLTFQYVPIKLNSWVTNINEEFIADFQQKLIMFSRVLADNAIIHSFDMKRIGISSNYTPKYFLGLDFNVQSKVEKILIKKSYRECIRSFFQPYLAKGNSTNTGNTSTFVKQRSGSEDFQSLPNSPSKITESNNDIMRSECGQNILLRKKGYKKVSLKSGIGYTEPKKTKFDETESIPNHYTSIKSMQYVKKTQKSEPYIEDFLNILQNQTPILNNLQQQQHPRQREEKANRYSQNPYEQQFEEVLNNKSAILYDTSHKTENDPLEKKVREVIQNSFQIINRLRKKQKNQN